MILHLFLNFLTAGDLNKSPPHSSGACGGGRGDGSAQAKARHESLTIRRIARDVKLLLAEIRRLALDVELALADLVLSLAVFLYSLPYYRRRFLSFLIQYVFVDFYFV